MPLFLLREKKLLIFLARFLRKFIAVSEVREKQTDRQTHHVLVRKITSSEYEQVKSTEAIFVV